jgi:hypothetical protein
MHLGGKGEEKREWLGHVCGVGSGVPGEAVYMAPHGDAHRPIAEKPQFATALHVVSNYTIETIYVTLVCTCLSASSCLIIFCYSRAISIHLSGMESCPSHPV